MTKPKQPSKPKTGGQCNKGSEVGGGVPVESSQTPRPTAPATSHPTVVVTTPTNVPMAHNMMINPQNGQNVQPSGHYYPQQQGVVHNGSNYMQLTNCINDQTTYQAQQQQQRFQCATSNPPNYGYSQPSAAVGFTGPQHGIQGGDTQTIIALIQQLRDDFSKRLNCIENKVSKLDEIKSEISAVKSDVAGLRSENMSINSRLDDIETSCQVVSSVFDDFQAHKTQCSKNSIDLYTKTKNMDHELSSLREINTELRKNITDLQWRSMRDNLLFVGVPEIQQSTSNQNGFGPEKSCEQTLREFLSTRLENDPSINTKGDIDIKNIQFARVHRVGAKHHDRARPIVAKFERFADRELIRKAGIVLNQKKCGVYVNEQYPSEMEERRRKLFPIMQQYKRDPHITDKCTLVKDQLYVGKRLYNLDTGSLHTPTAKQRQPEQNGSRPPMSVRPYTWRTENKSTKPLTNKQTVDFRTPNKFESLSQETPQRRRPLCDRSPPTPLEMESKRQRDEDTDRDPDREQPPTSDAPASSTAQHDLPVQNGETMTIDPVH